MTREELTNLLNEQVDRWSAKPYAQLVEELRDVVNYTVDHPAAECQVEVLLLENRPEYLHVCVSVSDETFWRSISPLTRSFLVYP